MEHLGNLLRSAWRVGDRVSNALLMVPFRVCVLEGSGMQRGGCSSGLGRGLGVLGSPNVVIRPLAS